MKKKISTSFEHMRTFNGVMAVVYTVQGFAILFFSSDFRLPVTTSFLQFDAVTQQANPVAETVMHVQLGSAVAVFFFLSGLAHILLVLPGFFERYGANLKKRINPLRWYEYALSSSLMLVLIAMLVGVYDGMTLLLLFGLNAVMNLCGLLMELHNQTTKTTDWTAFSVGVIAGVVPLLVIAFSFLGAATAPNTSVPAFVPWIIASIFLTFSMFTVNMVLQYKRVGPWKEYLFGERAYIVLSLVAKSLLAWQVFAGTLRPM